MPAISFTVGISGMRRARSKPWYTLKEAINKVQRQNLTKFFVISAHARIKTALQVISYRRVTV